MIFLTLGDRIYIMELARGSFQDENSVPSCKKYHSLAHASKNPYTPLGYQDRPTHESFETFALWKGASLF